MGNRVVAAAESAGAGTSMTWPWPPGPRLLDIDGSHGEGGGQIVRTALFLSTLLRQPLRIQRIRAGREKPGLKPQHAAILRLLAQMTGCSATGGEMGSSTLEFHPGAPKAGHYAMDIGTGGCVPLLLQAVLPVAVATPGRTRIRIVGGTDVPFGPTVDWLRQAYVPFLSRLAKVDVQVPRHGFAARGGGIVEVTVIQDAQDVDTAEGLRRHVAATVGARRIVQGKPAAIGIRSLAATSLGRDVAQRQAFAALAHLVGMGPTPAVTVDAVDTQGPGSSITCWIEDAHGNRLASDRLGQVRTRAEDVGKRAALNLLEDWQAGATVDRHLSDHIVPWVALGAGAVRVPHSTPHLETNAWLCNQMLGPNAVRVDRNLVR